MNNSKSINETSVAGGDLTDKKIVDFSVDEKSVDSVDGKSGEEEAPVKPKSYKQSAASIKKLENVLTQQKTLEMTGADAPPQKLTHIRKTKGPSGRRPKTTLEPTITSCDMFTDSTGITKPEKQNRKSKCLIM